MDPDCKARCRRTVRSGNLFAFYFVNRKNLVGFALAAGLFVSCATVSPRIQDQLVGEWRYADRAVTCHYVFDPDGRFHGEVTSDGGPLSRFTGRWSVEGDTLLYQYTGDALNRIPAGSVDRDKLVKVERDAVTIEAADGSRRRYVRVH